VKYDMGELKDILNGAKNDTAHVKRIVLACERDMEDFTAAMDAVNVDLDEMRARVDSTHSIITSRQRVEATVTAEISTMRLDMGDMQEALKAHDAWMEDVSQSLQECHERCGQLSEDIIEHSQQTQAKLDAKTDITSWNDMNDDIDSSVKTVLASRVNPADAEMAVAMQGDGAVMNEEEDEVEEVGAVFMGGSSGSGRNVAPLQNDVAGVNPADAEMAAAMQGDGAVMNEAAVDQKKSITCGRIKANSKGHKHRAPTHEFRPLLPEELAALIATAGQQRVVETADGKPYVLTLQALRQKDPSYLTWLVMPKLHLIRPSLRKALKEFGFWGQQEQVTVPSDRALSPQRGPVPEASDAQREILVLLDQLHAKPEGAPVAQVAELVPELAELVPEAKKRRKSRSTATVQPYNCSFCRDLCRNAVTCPLRAETNGAEERRCVQAAHRAAGAVARDFGHRKYVAENQRSDLYSAGPQKRSRASNLRSFAELQRASPEQLCQWMVEDGLFESLSGTQCRLASCGAKSLRTCQLWLCWVPWPAQTREGTQNARISCWMRFATGAALAVGGSAICVATLCSQLWVMGKMGRHGKSFAFCSQWVHSSVGEPRVPLLKQATWKNAMDQCFNERSKIVLMTDSAAAHEEVSHCGVVDRRQVNHSEKEYSRYVSALKDVVSREERPAMAGTQIIDRERGSSTKTSLGDSGYQRNHIDAGCSQHQLLRRWRRGADVGEQLSRLSADDQDHAMRLEHSILSVQNKSGSQLSDQTCGCSTLDTLRCSVHRRAYLVEGELHLYKDPPANTSPKSASGIGTSAKRFPPELPIKAPRQNFPAELPGRASRQGFPAELPVRASRQSFPAELPGKASRQSFPAKLPGKASRQSFPAEFPGRASRQSFPAELPAKAVQMSLSGAIQGRLRDTWDVDDFLLGSGGFSVVFPGWSRRSDEIFCEVAVKLLSRRNHMSDVRNEVKYLIACRDHPNIIQFRGAFFLSAEEQVLNEQRVAENRPKRWTGPAQYALVFELFVGGDMWQFLETKGALTEHHAVRIMHGVFSALAFIHERRIIHRDVKCENIMVRDDDTAVLADFGLAMLVPEGVDIRQIAGSAGYAAPEQLSKKCRYGLKVDLFGAGVCFYRGLARAMPFPGSNKEEIIKATAVCKPDYNRIAFQSISEHMLHFLQHLISKKPNHRPSAAEALEQTAALQSEDAEVRNASGALAGIFATRRRLASGFQSWTIRRFCLYQRGRCDDFLFEGVAASGS
ncbi:unnamed protein product, partial [Polarella glacialis]